MNNFVGHNDPDGIETIYFIVASEDDPSDTFFRLTNHRKTPSAKSGGAFEGGAKVITTDGRVFFAIQYHGDVAGWREDLEYSLLDLKLDYAKVIDNKFVISDGCEYSLQDVKYQRI